MWPPMFEEGSRWKHKQLHILVFIRSRGTDENGHAVFRLGEIPRLGETLPDYGADVSPLKMSIWTAEELIRNFKPVIGKLSVTAIDILLAGGPDLNE